MNEVFSVRPVKEYRGRIGKLDSFLTSATDGGEWLTSRPVRFTPAKELRYSQNRRVSGPDRRLDVLATSSSRTLDRPARSLVAISTRLLRLRFIITN